MIRYERLENKTDDRQDVKVITDDANAEMAKLQDAFESADAEEMQTFRNIEGCERGDEGNFEFIIPGDEVADVSDLTWEADDGLLESEIEKWNEQMLAESDADDS